MASIWFHYPAFLTSQSVRHFPLFVCEPQKDVMHYRQQANDCSGDEEVLSFISFSCPGPLIAVNDHVDA
jgi:hypothetical protein